MSKSAKINATGGTGTKTYSIDGTTYQSGNTFTGLADGNYTAYVKDANNCVATRAFYAASTPQPGTVSTVYSGNSETENLVIPLYRTVMAFNWQGGTTADWGTLWTDEDHHFLMKHHAEYLTEEVWNFMRRPGCQIESKACGPINYTSGTTTWTYEQNRYRIKDTATGEYFDWGSQKNFDFGMADGQWSTFVPFGNPMSLNYTSLLTSHMYYVDIRNGVKTIAQNANTVISMGGDDNVNRAMWVNLISGTGTLTSLKVGGRYNSTNKLFTVGDLEGPTESPSTPRKYADTWSSSEPKLEGISTRYASNYLTPTGANSTGIQAMTAFIPNYNGTSHAWTQVKMSYLYAQTYFAQEAPANPTEAQFFSGTQTITTTHVGGVVVDAGTSKKAVKSLATPGDQPITSWPNPTDRATHIYNDSYDFTRYAGDQIHSWLVPIVGDFWYNDPTIQGGSLYRKKDIDDYMTHYVCTYIPPYFM